MSVQFLQVRKIFLERLIVLRQRCSKHRSIRGKVWCIQIRSSLNQDCRVCCDECRTHLRSKYLEGSRVRGPRCGKRAELSESIRIATDQTKYCEECDRGQKLSSRHEHYPRAASAFGWHGLLLVDANFPKLTRRRRKNFARPVGYLWQQNRITVRQSSLALSRQAASVLQSDVFSSSGPTRRWSERRCRLGPSAARA